jgi:hypothetical protein
MKIRYLTAASVFAAMVAVAGCGGSDDTWDDRTTTTDTWDDQTRTEPTTTQPATPAGRADQTWQYDPDTEQTEPVGTTGGVVGTQRDPATDPMTPDTQRTAPDVDMTEFAALDTDASGSLTEEQWVPEALGGVEFSEVDRDGDGIVTREEFRQHFVEGGGAGAGESASQ